MLGWSIDMLFSIISFNSSFETTADGSHGSQSTLPFIFLALPRRFHFLNSPLFGMLRTALFHVGFCNANLKMWTKLAPEEGGESMASGLLQRAGGQAGEPGAAGAESALLGGEASLCGLGCLGGTTVRLWERRFTLSRRCCYRVKAQLGVRLNFSLKSLVVLEAAFLKNPPFFIFCIFFFI